MRRYLAVLVPVVMASMAGPLALAANSVSERDHSDIYLLVGTSAALARIEAMPGIREIGPYRAPFARMIQARPDIHVELVRSRYWVIPASVLAEICGLKPSV